MQAGMLEMIVDDGETVHKFIRCANSIQHAKKKWAGNGEFIRVKDVTDQFPISEQKVHDALRAAGFGDPERETIVDLLRQGYANTTY